jgi:sec-independent protein translocase protein TatB
MFDIGFSEIVIIAVVALVVLGPEKLPKTARTLGHLFGRLQRYVADVKADINREIELDELRKLQQTVRTAATELETSMTVAARDVESGVRSVESELNAAPGVSAVAPAGSTPVAEGASAERLAAAGSPAPAPAASGAALSPEAAGVASGSAPQQSSLPGFDRG